MIAVAMRFDACTYRKLVLFFANNITCFICKECNTSFIKVHLLLQNDYCYESCCSNCCFLSAQLVDKHARNPLLKY